MEALLTCHRSAGRFVWTGGFLVGGIVSHVMSAYSQCCAGLSEEHRPCEVKGRSGATFGARVAAVAQILSSSVDCGGTERSVTYAVLSFLVRFVLTGEGRSWRQL